jgi:hypothetical protein
MLRRALTGAALAALLCFGCGPRNNPTIEKTVPVRGTVVLASGKPIRGGRVTFRPTDPTKGEAWAMLSKEGRFELGTYKKDDGAMPGTYKVLVEPLIYDQRGNLRPDKSLAIPTKYASADASDLTVDVKDDSGADLKLVLR